LPKTTLPSGVGKKSKKNRQNAFLSAHLLKTVGKLTYIKTIEDWQY